ncbi:hypothetical protein AVEN_183473-1 [Araneus ventricosus]|uniref:Uncharacterized protein n=1 Tax=Araneus ventricosus TaxID=182803 RepID=A0A4Y2P7Y8_ARAVE|nr:hypothetical protein AVEN_183473-1 [Araneus ventricosus]
MPRNKRARDAAKLVRQYENSETFHNSADLLNQNQQLQMQVEELKYLQIPQTSSAIDPNIATVLNTLMESQKQLLEHQINPPNVPCSKARTVTVVTRTKNTQQQLSFPLLDGSTTNQIPFSATSDRWQQEKSYSKQLSHFKVYDAFHSTKSARACAQTIVAAICAYASSTRKCNYRFLDIQIISNNLGVARVVHRAAQSYSDVSIRLRTENSFSLVVKMLDLGPKGLHTAIELLKGMKLAACQLLPGPNPHNVYNPNNVCERHLANKRRFKFHPHLHSFEPGDLVLYDWSKQYDRTLTPMFKRLLMIVQVGAVCYEIKSKE